MGNLYVFILGNHPDLSTAEIKSFFSYNEIEATFSSVSSEILLVNTKSPVDVKKMINFLGGTIKIAQILGKANSINSFEDLVKYFKNIVATSNFDFGLSFYNYPISSQTIFHYCKNIKIALKKEGIKASYTLPKKGVNLSSAQVSRKIFPNGLELIVFAFKDEVYFAKTIVLQDIKLFSTLDYGIPFINPRIGMLPPKLAQIMVNLALPEKKIPFTIYDPFCGQGRVVLQSLMQGLEAYGSDKDPKAVLATSKNILWLKNKFHLKFDDNYPDEHIFRLDASAENSKLKNKNIEAIACEPDLGPACRKMITGEEIDKIFKRLSDLYLTSFTQFKKIISPKAKIVCVFPMINDESLLDEIIDNITALGYYMVDDFKYGRSYQVVKRHIGVFKIKF